MIKKYPPEIRQKAIDLYQSGLSTRKAGRNVGASAHAVKTWIQQAGGTLRPPIAQAIDYPPEIKQKAINLYQSGLSLEKAGEPVGVNATAVQGWLEEVGIDRRPAHQPDEKTETLKEKAKALYEDNHSASEIARVVGRSQTTVIKWLKQKKVELREVGRRSKNSQKKIPANHRRALTNSRTKQNDFNPMIA